VKKLQNWLTVGEVLAKVRHHTFSETQCMVCARKSWLNLWSDNR